MNTTTISRAQAVHHLLDIEDAIEDLNVAGFGDDHESVRHLRAEYHLMESWLERDDVDRIPVQSPCLVCKVKRPTIGPDDAKLFCGPCFSRIGELFSQGKTTRQIAQGDVDLATSISRIAPPWAKLT